MTLYDKIEVDPGNAQTHQLPFAGQVSSPGVPTNLRVRLFLYKIICKQIHCHMLRRVQQTAVDSSSQGPQRKAAKEYRSYQQILLAPVSNRLGPHHLRTAQLRLQQTRSLHK